MSSFHISPNKYVEFDSNLHKNSFTFLSEKNVAMCPLDYLEECENDLTSKEEQSLYMKEFNSFVYLVSSRSQEFFDEEAAISRITTVQIITDDSY